MQENQHEAFLLEMREMLHDLCQPLTALQCRLEIGRMQPTPALLLEALEESLSETRRMFASIAVMRERLIREASQEQELAQQHEPEQKEV